MSEQQPAVILCGPFPVAGNIGGFARCNELIATSFLQQRCGIHRLPVTVPGDGGLARRMWVDLRNTRRCLREIAAPIFHLTAQYMRGTYREYLQYRMACGAGRAFVYDIRANCFIEAYEDRSAPFRRRLQREMVVGAAAVTVEGRSMVDWIRREFGREAVWFPNFVQSGHRREYPRAELEAPARGEPTRLAYAGRLVEGKGLKELLSAVARLAGSGAGVSLTLLGGGTAEYERSLRDLAASLGCAERVKLTGIVSHDEVLRILATQHIFVFPTLKEGHPNAVNEAMQVGLPVVTTRCGFLPDVVTPDCGIILPEAEPALLAEAIASLSGDWNRLRACGEAAYERVYREFSDEGVLGRLAEVYDDLLSRHRSPQTRAGRS